MAADDESALKRLLTSLGLTTLPSLSLTMGMMRSGMAGRWWWWLGLEKVWRGRLRLGGSAGGCWWWSVVAEVKEVGLARQDGEQWSSERIVIDAMFIRN